MSYLPLYYVMKGSKMGHETEEINISRISPPCAYHCPWPLSCGDVFRSIHNAYVQTVFNALLCTKHFQGLPSSGEVWIRRLENKCRHFYSLSLSLTLSIELLLLFINTSPYSFTLFPFASAIYSIPFLLPNLLTIHGMCRLVLLPLQMYLHFITISNVHFPVISVIRGLLTTKLEIHFYGIFTFGLVLGVPRLQQASYNTPHREKASQVPICPIPPPQWRNSP